MNAAEALLAAGDSDAPALITQEETHRYGDLRHAVGALAEGLRMRGLAPGDRVLVVAETSLLGVAGYLAVMHAGGVAVPLSPQIDVRIVDGIRRSTGARIGIAQARVLEDLGPALGELDCLILDEAAPPPSARTTVTLLPEILAQANPAAATSTPTGRSDSRSLAALLFTSGSTQEPRGVMLSHGNILANTRSILGYLPLTARDRAMMVLPFYYSFGASLLHTHLSVGAALVVDRRFMFPDKVLKRMQETRCTGFAGVPSHFQVLLRRSQLKKLSFPDLRWVQQAGGKLPSHFVQELLEALPQTKVYVMYGATEATARLSALLPDQLGAKLGSVGRPIPGVTIRILDEEGRELPSGETGEIVAQGDNVARGYWGDPPESATTFREGRLHTGDLGYLDAEGFLFIVDRAKDFIKCGGNRTSTKLLEEVLLKFPDIAEAAVLGIPDDTLGEAAAALVVPRSQDTDATLEARLLAFAEAHLDPPLVPRRIRVVPALPKNAAGKVLRPKLRALLDAP